MAFEFLTHNSIIYVLIVWVAVFAIAKALKLDKHGFEIKPYSLTYKNQNVQLILTRILNRTQRATRVFANTSVVLGFVMIGEAGAANAALFAVAMLAISDEEMARSLSAFRERQTQAVLSAKLPK